VTAVAGLRFVLEPEDGLSRTEREWLSGLPSLATRKEGPVVRIRLEAGGRAAAASESAPARVSWDGGLLLLRHAAFEADLDPAAGTAIVRRHPDSAAGLATTLRMAVSARLPLEGGVLVHAACLERAGRGFVFFGPSGVGKSTLVERSPWPALSDELVAVLPCGDDEPHRVTGATFPGPPNQGRAPSTTEPRLACLVELAQGPRFHLERLAPIAALRRLVGSIAVPPSPPLWSAALSVSGEIARQVACYRMAWSLDESPFELLEAALAGDGRPAV
jgi:hypothetical protein